MEPYIGEIRAFAHARKPQGWEPCEGQLLSVKQYQPLFSVLGAAYGGDGKTTFGLPDLRGRVPVGAFGPDQSTYGRGRPGGRPTVTLLGINMPPHFHRLRVGETAVSNSVRNTLYGPTPGLPLYEQFWGSVTEVDSGMLEKVGKEQPHDNMQPYLAIRYCIAIEGAFPLRPWSTSDAEEDRG